MDDQVQSLITNANVLVAAPEEVPADVKAVLSEKSGSKTD